ncbi:AMP deaminase [Neolecta irregularis DAH-3]|uniref:AMP deaminase n=1 Tax=Neolecta irregularis (strain DAH-3) TaxID=1198029 RepID=A0A1U7LUA5_NEOID|nr:AMP deaminase [Neolecta irregularis DAH-3]|eukprot:OLL26247.1 AMP deaminase [Neolecta irregularis DAH-3]
MTITQPDESPPGRIFSHNLDSPSLPSQRNEASMNLDHPFYDYNTEKTMHEAWRTLAYFWLILQLDSKYWAQTPGGRPSDSAALLGKSTVDAEPQMPNFKDFNPNVSNALYHHGTVITAELEEIYTSVQKCLDLRNKYIQVSHQRPFDNPKDDIGNWNIYPPPPEPAWRPDGKIKHENSYNLTTEFNMDECEIPGEYEMKVVLENGIYQVYLDGEPIVKVPTIKEYYLDLDEIQAISSDGPAKSFAFRRLQYLESRWNLYILLNEYQELADSKRVPHRDFYNVRKVDTHVHHSACMNQKHLLRFIKSKLKKQPDELVLRRDGKYLTLAEVFKSLNLTAYDLSIDTLDMHAHKDSFHRFDKFNLKYNPIGESRLRTIFLKTDNDIEGRYLAELTKEVISDVEQSKYQMAEYRISIYGRSKGEWDKLASWIVDNKLFSPNIRWLIQIPRLYNLYKESGIVETFDDIIKNLFQPLFEVSQDPSTHPKLHVFLQRVIGFDSVDDESKAEKRLYRKFPIPKEWNTTQNPPYSYWIYYLFANMTSLNTIRKQRGFNTFVLRPHAGEAGDTDHLAAAYLTCHSISHGILLRKVPFLQYLFYLQEIPIAMSPLSNNALFLSYERNPFPSFFRRGLNVSLSTDDPLQFAFTKEPLIEEYSVAAQIYKLSAVDMCELAKNSVLQSGFEGAMKARWLGDSFAERGVRGNDVQKTNIPDVRMKFRYDTWVEEIGMILKYANGGRSFATSMEASVIEDASESLRGLTTAIENWSFPGISIIHERRGENPDTRFELDIELEEVLYLQLEIEIITYFLYVFSNDYVFGSPFFSLQLTFEHIMAGYSHFGPPADYTLPLALPSPSPSQHKVSFANTLQVRSVSRYISTLHVESQILARMTELEQLLDRLNWRSRSAQSTAPFQVQCPAGTYRGSEYEFWDQWEFYQHAANEIDEMERETDMEWLDLRERLERVRSGEEEVDEDFWEYYQNNGVYAPYPAKQSTPFLVDANLGIIVDFQGVFGNAQCIVEQGGPSAGYTYSTGHFMNGPLSPIVAPSENSTLQQYQYGQISQTY